VIKDHLEYEEQHALEAILCHHLSPGAPHGPLKRDLATFINWVRATEATKSKFSVLADEHPPFLIVLLGQMGIYSKAKK
jgi:hypothetical protein